MRLGETVSNIRALGYYLKGEDAAERRAWLDEMGFVWDDLERRWEGARSALATFLDGFFDFITASAPSFSSSPISAASAWTPVQVLHSLLLCSSRQLTEGRRDFLLVHVRPADLTRGLPRLSGSQTLESRS